MNDSQKRRANGECKALRIALKEKTLSLKAAEERLAELSLALAAAEKKIVELTDRLNRPNEGELESLVMNNEELKRQIIGEYLASLYGRKSAPVLTATVGAAPLTPPKKPKDLSEARRLAEIMLK